MMKSTSEASRCAAMAESKYLWEPSPGTSTPRKHPALRTPELARGGAQPSPSPMAAELHAQGGYGPIASLVRNPGSSFPKRSVLPGVARHRVHPGVIQPLVGPYRGYGVDPAAGLAVHQLQPPGIDPLRIPPRFRQEVLQPLHQQQCRARVRCLTPPRTVRRTEKGCFFIFLSCGFASPDMSGMLVGGSKHLCGVGCGGRKRRWPAEAGSQAAGAWAGCRSRPARPVIACVIPAERMAA